MNRHAKAPSVGLDARAANHSALWSIVSACALAVFILFAGFTCAAQASQTHPYLGSFGPEGPGSSATFHGVQGVAVDQASGDVYVFDPVVESIYKFDSTGQPVDFSDLSSNAIEGIEGVEAAGNAENELAIAPPGAPGGTAGDIYIANPRPGGISIYSPGGTKLGEIATGSGEVCGVATDSSGDVFVGIYPQTIREYVPSANPVTDADEAAHSSASLPEICNIAADGLGNVYASNYLGHGAVKLEGLGTSEASLVDSKAMTLAVDPASNDLYADRTDSIAQYDSSGALLSVFGAEQLANSFGVAVDGASGNVYAANGARVEIFGPSVTLPDVSSEAAVEVGKASATLNGVVNPEGVALTGCKFEYGLTTSVGFEDEAQCSPSASEIPTGSSAHSVSAALTKLQANVTYKVRLAASNANGTARSGEVTFTTLGPPQITEIRALNAGQSAANIEGKINPSGFGASYRFEWGPTASYGNQIPADFEPFIGSGNEPVRVSVKLNGLSAGQVYHYRIVATSSVGTTASPDQTVETLNSCGLPESRCFELVSRREGGPVVIPGETLSQNEMHYQAATGGPGSVAYVTEAGYPEATKGAEVLYRGTRGPSGWDSTQLSTPITALNERPREESVSGMTKWLSNDLSCGFAESYYPLTADPSMRLVREYGSANLYRVNPDNSYTGVSRLAPENPGAHAGSSNYYSVDGASQNCSKVLFNTSFHYPDIPGFNAIGEQRLYEWDEGTLRNVGVVPGPSGEVVVAAMAGTESNSLNTVSEDGSRVFFTAQRQISANPAEIGKEAIFVREDGTTTRDVSLSETSVSDKGATYQWASPDGSRVFFTANAGLTESSSKGPDLYMYDLESEKLTDLTAYDGEGGAQVAGFIAAAENGSHVYFASPNQLVPGRGKTLAENQSDETLSIYGESNGEFSFVGTFSTDAINHLYSVVLKDPYTWTSRVSPNGRYLLFESSVKVTGFDNNGVLEAYLYDADDGSEGTVCVSCRQDGLPSVAPAYSAPEFHEYQLLPVGPVTTNPLHPAQFLTMHGGEPQVFFSSPDKLAPGAVEYQNNIYEWTHGQVFRLVSARENQQPRAIPGHYATFAGASSDGSDAYMVTPETLNWEDGDERLSVYDARVGGGYPEPPAPPAPCEATSEGSGSCQGSAQGAPALSGAASASFNGPGNPPEQSTKKKSKKKPHKKKQKHAKKKKGNGKQARYANANGRAGK